jgi:uncharacterized membrane protein
MKSGQKNSYEESISFFLFWGVLLSLMLITAGTFGGLSHGDITIKNISRQDHSIHLIPISRGIISMGILILIFIPFCRVFYSIRIFMKNNDRKFVICSLIVFLIQIASLIVSFVSMT